MSVSSIPSLTEFDPRVIRHQARVIRDIRARFDYSRGVQQVLLSGAVGSAKTLTLAHVIVTHALLYPGAQIGIGRLTMPALKKTLLDVVLKHLGDHVPYKYNRTEGTIEIGNGSRVIPFSWKDLNVKKFRSHEFSLFVIEELTETKTQDFYDEIVMRMGRLKHVPECLILCATNPDDPEHWAYKHFIESEDPNVHVYYSITTDNPFLPPSYIESLKRTLDPKMASRMLEGKWLSINKEVVYYAYSKETNFKKEAYKPIQGQAIRLGFDFNIGAGKPMSACAFQHLPAAHDGRPRGFHFFHEWVVEGARTEDILEEIAGSGLLELGCRIIVHGDATGRSNDTRSKKSDYTIIEKFLANYRTPKGRAVDFEIDVPKANPPVRKRHNLMNGAMKNALGEVSLYVYQGCKNLDEGFRLTKLLPGGKYVEDDSKPYQHVTTAAGYGVVRILAREERGESTMQEI